ncbi:MAG: LysR family transcriptional regulator [Geobacter sp.]|nr:LysR family transcriptional regulator [Geobacter sp.]
METQYMKTLIAVAETGSFSKAAGELNITQSAVSQRIKYLEERYGYQLLDRSGQALVTTQVGDLVIEKSRRILEIEKELLDGLKRFGGKTRLAICCTPTFGIGYMPGVLNTFMMQNASIVDLKFMFYTPEQALKGLKDNDFDIAVIEHCDDMDFSGFLSFRLPQDELVFISSPKLGISEPALGIDNLLKNRLFARKEGCSSRKMLKTNLANCGKEVDDFASVVVHDDLRFTIQAVMGGGGVAFVSRALIAEYVKNGVLREHFVEGFCHVRNRTVAINSKVKSDTTIQKFLDCIFAAFNSSVNLFQIGAAVATLIAPECAPPVIC